MSKTCSPAVDVLPDLVQVEVVLHAVDAADGGAGTVGDQDLGLLPDLLDPLDGMGRGDAALDDGDVDSPRPISRTSPRGIPLRRRASRTSSSCLAEVGHLELAALAAGKIKKCDFWFYHVTMPRFSVLISS